LLDLSLFSRPDPEDEAKKRAMSDASRDIVFGGLPPFLDRTNPFYMESQKRIEASIFIT